MAITIENDRQHPSNVIATQAELDIIHSNASAVQDVYNIYIASDTGNTYRALADGTLKLIGGGFNPCISSISPSVFNHAETKDICIEGDYFVKGQTTVSIAGQTVNSVTVVNSSKLIANVTSNSTDGLYDVTVDNGVGSDTLTGGFQVLLSVWLDMTNAADFATANWQSIGSATTTITQTANGVQFNKTTTAWNTFAKATGACGSVSQNFEMVVYRTGTARRAMLGLLNQATTSVTGNSYRQQYVGYWNFGASTNRLYGSQFNEGGVNWSQAFTNVATPAGSFIKVKYFGAGQNGQTVEFWNSDASFSDLSLITSFTSNKPATPATDVCFSVANFDAGVSDYYVRGLKIG